MNRWSLEGADHRKMGLQSLRPPGRHHYHLKKMDSKTGKLVYREPFFRFYYYSGKISLVQQLPADWDYFHSISFSPQTPCFEKWHSRQLQTSVHVKYYCVRMGSQWGDIISEGAETTDTLKALWSKFKSYLHYL